MTAPFPDHPQLKGNYAPLRMECDLEDMVVRGRIPPDLNITLYRNGPDPQYPPQGRHHWFAGDGMVHMFHIRNGRARYRNRWARTVKWNLERTAGRVMINYVDPGHTDPSAADIDEDGLANTNIVWHAGKLLALEEDHAPFEMDPVTLAGRGAWRFDGKLVGPMTAHPKIDPKTGQMLSYGYMVDGPFGAGMSFHEIDAAGKLTRLDRFQAPYPSMVHDFITTDTHIIFPIYPLTGSLDRARQGQPPFAWEPQKPTCIGIMRRNDEVGQIRWFETDPCYVFHHMNAYSQGSRIVAHVMRFEEAPLFPHADGSEPDPEKASARLFEWSIDLDDPKPAVAWRQLDDLSGDFPRLDERFAGLRYRHGYYCASVENPLAGFDAIEHIASWFGDQIQGGDGGGFNALAHYDFASGARTVYKLPKQDKTSEAVFVPKSTDAPEGQGYLLSVIYRASEHRSDLAFFDAEHLDRGPFALAQLPHRIPFGFHGNWRYNEG